MTQIAEAHQYLVEQLTTQIAKNLKEKEKLKVPISPDPNEQLIFSGRYPSDITSELRLMRILEIKMISRWFSKYNCLCDFVTAFLDESDLNVIL